MFVVALISPTNFLLKWGLADFIFSPAGVLRQRASGCLPRSLGRACPGTWCSLSDSSSGRRGRPRWRGSRIRAWWERSEWDVSVHWGPAEAGAGCCTGGTCPGSTGPSTPSLWLCKDQKWTWRKPFPLCVLLLCSEHQVLPPVLLGRLVVEPHHVVRDLPGGELRLADVTKVSSQVYRFSWNYYYSDSQSYWHLLSSGNRSQPGEEIQYFSVIEWHDCWETSRSISKELCFGCLVASPHSHRVPQKLSDILLTRGNTVRWHSFFYAANTEKEPRRDGVVHHGIPCWEIDSKHSFLSLIHLLRWIDNKYQ